MGGSVSHSEKELQILFIRIRQNPTQLVIYLSDHCLFISRLIIMTQLRRG